MKLDTLKMDSQTKTRRQTGMLEMAVPVGMKEGDLEDVMHEVHNSDAEMSWMLEHKFQWHPNVKNQLPRPDDDGSRIIEI